MGVVRLRVFFSVFFLPLLMVVADLVRGAQLTVWTLYNFAVWPLVLFASLTVHELGHAAVGRVVGLNPRFIFLGLGRELARWRFSGVEVRLNALPLLGLTLMEATGERALRLRAFAAFAAGPAATGGLLLFLLAIGPPASVAITSNNMVSQPAAWGLAVFVNVVMLITNLWPMTVSAGFRSDGRLLLSLPFMKLAKLKELLISHLMIDVMVALERHELDAANHAVNEALVRLPDSFTARLMRSTIDMEEGRWAEARAHLISLRGSGESFEKHERLSINNNLAWVNFLIGDDQFLGEADQLSEEVLREFRAAAFALSTRGAVLVWEGKSEEACALLERAHLTNNGAWARAFNSCCLVLAYAKRGDPARARMWLEQAKRDDPLCTLLPRAIQALEADPAAR